MKKVVYYARVSTDSKVQLHSLEEQRKYFMKYINENVNYYFCGEYIDEGITGTSLNKREAFNKMIYDAMNHKFDLILVKDISRFSRNTLDTIEQTRKLKENGIDVIFINDRIDTSTSDGELNLTLLATMAQEESRKISNRVNWTIQNELKQGVMYLTSIYGYDIVDRKLYINEEEAEVVKLIYNSYLSGMGYTRILKLLNKNQIKSPKGHSVWNTRTIQRILKNEKYVGHLINGKTHVVDYLTHKVENVAIENQYRFENNHQGIIDQDTFQKVQLEMKRRNKDTILIRHNTVFTGKIECFYCHSFFQIESGKKKSYICHKHSIQECDNNNSLYIKIMRDMLIFLFKNLFFNKTQIENKVVKTLKKNKKYTQALNKKNQYEKKIKVLNEKKEEYLERLLNDEIESHEYSSLVNNIENELTEYEIKIKEYDNNEVEILEKTICNCKEIINHILESNESFYDTLINRIIDKIIFRNRNDFDLYINTSSYQYKTFNKTNYSFITTLEYDFSNLQMETSPKKYQNLKDTKINLYMLGG